MTPQKNFPITEELIRRVVKEETRNLLTKEYVDDQFNELNEKIKGLPTKEHFDERMDKLTAEIQVVRDEQTLHQGQHDEINERLDTIEQKVGIQPL